MADSKIIFVIGATGAQGAIVIKHLLAPTKEGKSSPWRVRALSRDLDNHRVKQLQEQGVEFLRGSFTDYDVIAKGMEGAYGAFVNTDGFTVGAQVELHAGIRIFEIAQRAKVQHFVYSGLNYVTKQFGWDPKYEIDFWDGKGRVGEYLLQQPSVLGEGMIWTNMLTGPYMDMIKIGLFSPLNRREDGTVVFASPLGDGHAPMIALEDLGWWARWMFDSPQETSGKTIGVGSQSVGVDDIVEAFTKVTGAPAVAVKMEVDDYLELFTDLDVPINDMSPTTFRHDFGGAWRLWRDDKILRDIEWCRSIHPQTRTVEDWMRETNYDGTRKVGLKRYEDGQMKGMRPNFAKMREL